MLIPLLSQVSDNRPGLPPVGFPSSETAAPYLCFLSNTQQEASMPTVLQHAVNSRLRIQFSGDCTRLLVALGVILDL